MVIPLYGLYCLHYSSEGSVWMIGYWFFPYLIPGTEAETLLSHNYVTLLSINIPFNSHQVRNQIDHL